MEEPSEQATVAADDAAAADATNKPPRFPQFGKYEGLAPMHLSPFAIETNVSRIAQQIAEGRTPTFD